MDINRLKVFRAIVESGSMRRAAELLHRTPGALSKAVAQLEEELGRELFIPSGRGIAVTDEGMRLYDASEPVVRAFEGMMAGLDMARRPEPVLRIGSFELFTTYCLGAVIEAALKDVPLAVSEWRVGEIEAALAGGEIDLGITFVPYPRAEIELVRAAPLTFGIYARKGAFHGRPFAEVPFAIPARTVRGAPLPLLGLDGWPDDKVPRTVRYRFALLESGLEMARRGFCAVFMPDFIARLHNRAVIPACRLERIPLPRGMAPVKHAVFAATRKSDANNPFLPRIVGALRKVCTAEGVR